MNDKYDYTNQNLVFKAYFVFTTAVTKFGIYCCSDHFLVDSIDFLYNESKDSMDFPKSSQLWGARSPRLLNRFQKNWYQDVAGDEICRLR